MNTVAAPSQASRSQVIPVPDWVRSGPRLVFGGLAAALLLAAGAFGQPWLETLGVGSIVLSFLPCAAMCAAGLCMKGGAESSARSGGGGTTAGLKSLPNSSGSSAPT